jgi:hypothetical protein
MATMREARLKDIRNIITDEKGKDEELSWISLSNLRRAIQNIEGHWLLLPPVL